MNLRLYTSILLLPFLLYTCVSGIEYYSPYAFHWEYQNNHIGFDHNNNVQALDHPQCVFQSDLSYNYQSHHQVHHQPHFNHFTMQDFDDYFTARGYTESEILNQRRLYMSDEFVRYAQTYPSYKVVVQQIYAEIKNLNALQKAYYIIKGTYCYKLQKRMHDLFQQLSSIENDAFVQKESATLTKPILSIKNPAIASFNACHAEYKVLHDLYRTYAPSLSRAIDNRANVFAHVTNNDALHYTQQPYNLNENSKQLLAQYGHDASKFTHCHGHQLNHILHQESLNLLSRIDALPSYSILYDHQEALIDFTVAMNSYNHANLIDKAMNIADFCWTLLDYGQAIAEGAAIGVYSAVADIVHNPIEATVTILAGKQILAYQLCKVLYSVADIGVTAISNVDQAKDKWSKYTEPLNNIIDAINNKEISMRDALKNGTALTVGLIAQSKVLGGLGKFCGTIKQKVTRFVQNNIAFHPQEYCVTSEGLLFKATTQSNKLQQSGQATSSSLKKIVDNAASKKQFSVNQTSTAILKDGYYEVNGFRFTEYYYNRLWNNGREAPSLIAQAILDNIIQIIPDPENIPGFFKYFAEGWEMIYNPTTKIVSHIQQLKNLK